ncbi:MAG: CPBP family intramembrane glutamic endopeptidase [Pirellulaceae bacterium]
MNRLWVSVREFIAQPLREAREEQLRHLAADEGGQLDGQTIWMLVSVAVLLTLQYYYVTSGSSPLETPIRRWLESCFAIVPALRYDDRGELSRLGYWSLGNFVLYVAIPAIVVRGIFRQPLTQFGLKMRGWHQNWLVYVAFYLLLFPAVVLASQWQSFQSKYPFYRVLNGEFPGPRFYVWELLYAVQFVSLEFFFRGYMIQAGRKRLGPYVIFVMTVPYCMIHFGKPIQETLGAIVAGILLGFMALKTRSIWLGAALHIAVAWTMDALALMRK